MWFKLGGQAEGQTMMDLMQHIAPTDLAVNSLLCCGIPQLVNPNRYHFHANKWQRTSVRQCYF